LYPEKFGGYVLSPSSSAITTDYVRSAKAADKVREIRQIANTSITKNKEVFSFGDEIESADQMAKHTWMSINHAPGIAAYYKRVVVVINPDVAQRMTAVYFPVQGCDFTASITLWDRDMSAYYIPLKDKLNNNNNYSVDDFVRHINEVLKTISLVIQCLRML
jgi:hypothetical protein